MNVIKVRIKNQGNSSCDMEDIMESFVKAGCGIIVTASRIKWSAYDKEND